MGLITGALLGSPLAGRSQARSELGPTPLLDPVEGERRGRELVTNLLAQKPDQPSTTAAVLKIRDADRKVREVPARFEIVPNTTNWLNTYEAAASGIWPSLRLTIVHTANEPNQYFLSKLTPSGTVEGTPQKLTGAELMIPFAGSDFWVADLGLEFLHWPDQRVLKKQMKRGLMCDVLQSTNPQPRPGGYSKVISWIVSNRPDDIVIVHAESLDTGGRLLKEFDPKKVEKVNGVWQLSEMEIRNRQTGSRTRIEFNLDAQ